MPLETVFEIASTFSMRELLILAEDERFADFAHGELHRRALALVRRFKLPDQATMDMMDREDTVISGSASLFITAPGTWTPSDIDFYCPVGKLGAVVAFLTVYQYEVVPWPRRGQVHVVDNASTTTGTGTISDASDIDDATNADNDSGDEDTPSTIGVNPYARHVMKTVVMLRHQTEGCTLNVIESIVPCAEAPVFAFHSTVVMNVMTSKGVICYFPEWTFYNTGVVNRPDGLSDWNPKGEEKEKAAIAKYCGRGYSIMPDCVDLHVFGKDGCDACSPNLRNWSDGTSMTFRKGDTFRPAGRAFRWRLGAQPREKQNLFWRDRGVLIVVQGDGDGRAIVYDGLAKKKKSMTADSIREML